MTVKARSLDSLSSQQPRISFFLNNLNGGGIQRSVINLANEFVEQGLKVDIIVTKLVGPFVNEVSNQVELVDLGEPKFRQIPFKLAEYLRQSRPSVMLANMHYNNELAIFARFIAGVPTRIVVVDQNSLPTRQELPLTQPKYSLGLHPDRADLLIRVFYRWAYARVATSKGVAEDIVRISKLSPSQVHVIYNPIITNDLKLKAQEPVDHPWFSPDSPPIVLGVGRLEPQKDFFTLLQAFTLVRRQQDARLMILGAGSQREQLESLIRELDLTDHVSLPGYVNNPYAYMANASVFALSSAWEGFGNVIAEALAVGTPVVSTDCKSGPAEILADGKYGELVPVKDAQALSKALVKTLSEGGPHIPEEWLEQFSVKEAAKQYLQVLN